MVKTQLFKWEYLLDRKKKNREDRETDRHPYFPQIKNIHFFLPMYATFVKINSISGNKENLYKPFKLKI